MSGLVEIYVALLEEGVGVWRPVKAKHLGGRTYLIVDQAYERETELWEFEPGDRVICKEIVSEEGPILAAIEKAQDTH